MEIRDVEIATVLSLEKKGFQEFWLISIHGQTRPRKQCISIMEMTSRKYENSFPRSWFPSTDPGNLKEEKT